MEQKSFQYFPPKDFTQTFYFDEPMVNWILFTCFKVKDNIAFVQVINFADRQLPFKPHSEHASRALAKYHHLLKCNLSKVIQP